jgi:hypothetical protein
MPWSKSKSRGPMNMQPEHDASISPSLPLMPTLGETQKAPTTQKRPATRDAVRAAKARITRLRSLQKQRDAQMPNRQDRESDSRSSLVGKKALPQLSGGGLSPSVYRFIRYLDSRMFSGSTRPFSANNRHSGRSRFLRGNLRLAQL